jgi:hypothetical protein
VKPAAPLCGEGVPSPDIKGEAMEAVKILDVQP